MHHHSLKEDNELRKCTKLKISLHTGEIPTPKPWGYTDDSRFFFLLFFCPNVKTLHNIKGLFILYGNFPQQTQCINLRSVLYANLNNKTM